MPEKLARFFPKKNTFNKKANDKIKLVVEALKKSKKAINCFWPRCSQLKCYIRLEEHD